MRLYVQSESEVETNSFAFTWPSDVGRHDDEVLGAGHVGVPVETPLWCRHLYSGFIISGDRSLLWINFHYLCLL